MIDQAIEYMCTCTGNNYCTHYLDKEHICKFGSGNCGQRRAGRECSANGKPPAYLRQIKPEFVLHISNIERLGF